MKDLLVEPIPTCAYFHPLATALKLSELILKHNELVLRLDQMVQPPEEVIECEVVNEAGDYSDTEEAI